MFFVDDLNGAWQRCPSLRRLMAVVHGHKPPEKPSQDFSELLSMFPAGKIG